MVPPPLARPRRAGARIPPAAAGEAPPCTGGVCAFCKEKYCPRRAGARIPPPAGGETPLCTGACALCVKRNTARAAQAQNPLTELDENTNSLLTTAIR